VSKCGFLIALLATAVSVFATSYAFNVKPVGNLNGPVVFRFYDVSGKQIETRITDFTICERTSAKRWKPVWSLVGSKRVREITYGGSCPGLKESLGPKKLVSGKMYGVLLRMVLAGRLDDISDSRRTEE
jgi:hypothetical protein